MKIEMVRKELKKWGYSMKDVIEVGLLVVTTTNCGNGYYSNKHTRIRITERGVDVGPAYGTAEVD